LNEVDMIGGGARAAITPAASAPAAFAPRLLFVPVSGLYGMGEYARSLSIARAAQARWPKASIHFLLSREAPYAAATPFAHTLLPSSPTFQTPAASRGLRQRGPHGAAACRPPRGCAHRLRQRAAAPARPRLQTLVDAAHR
jgi:hypothetical protein